MLDSLRENRFEAAVPVLTRVFGPLAWRSELLAEAVFEGKPIWIKRLLTRANVDHAVALAAPLGRPVRVGVYTRHNTSGVGPELVTGDPRFDAAYILTGSPPEVVRAAFDEEARTTLAALWLPHQPSLRVGDEGFLEVGRHLPTSSELSFGQSRPITPEELAAKARWLQRVAERLVASFDATYAQLAQMQGAPAAAAWANGLRQVRSAEAERRRTVTRAATIAIVAFVAAVMLLALLIIAAKLYLDFM